MFENSYSFFLCEQIEHLWYQRLFLELAGPFKNINSENIESRLYIIFQIYITFTTFSLIFLWDDSIFCIFYSTQSGNGGADESTRNWIPFWTTPRDGSESVSWMMLKHFRASFTFSCQFRSSGRSSINK